MGSSRMLMQCTGFGGASAVLGCSPAAALPAAANGAARRGAEWKDACVALPLNYFFPMPSNITACCCLSCRWHLKSIFNITNLKNYLHIVLSTKWTVFNERITAAPGWSVVIVWLLPVVEFWLLIRSFLQQYRVCFLLFCKLPKLFYNLQWRVLCFAFCYSVSYALKSWWKYFIRFKGFRLYEMRPCTSRKLVRNRGTEGIALSAASGIDHMAMLHGGGRQQVKSNTVWFSLLGEWITASQGTNSDPCFSYSF